MALGMEVSLNPGDFMLDGDPAPLPKKGVEPPPEFSAHGHFGQTAGWIKTALGTEMGLVLDMDPALLPQKGAELPPQFSAHFYCGQTVGCVKMPLCMEVGLSPGVFVLNWDPAPSQKGADSPPQF